MLDIISGSLFVVVVIVVLLHPVYMLTVGAINTYLGSVSEGDWGIDPPYRWEWWVGLSDNSDKYGMVVSYVAIYFCLILLLGCMLGKSNPDGFLQGAYNVGTHLTEVSIVVVTLTLAHKGLKKLHALIKRNNFK